jgi:DNA repair exonuclease SbcCD ATPase subunit
MSDTLLLAILSISELALITTGVAVFLFLRYRRMSQQFRDAEAEPSIPEEIAKPDPEINFAEYLQQNIEQTKQKLDEIPEEHARILQTRLDYLQAEVNAQEQAENSAAYWEQLISSLDGVLAGNNSEEIMPQAADESSDDDQPTLNELDDIDIGDSFDEIPLLEDNVSEPGGVKKDPTLTIETANEDLERLRKIISRQHDTMDELKKSLQDKNINLDNNQELSQKLEEIEVAQAQLNMCVETLEKENERLNELIKDHEDSPQQEQLTLAKQELEEANERINTLEKENSLQAERITELESEIAELEKALEQRNEELARVQNLEADLSQTDDGEEPSQDSLMKEIETLTELITQKSEELSKLQSDTTDEFGFDSELPDLEDEDTTADKALKSG